MEVLPCLITFSCSPGSIGCAQRPDEPCAYPRSAERGAQGSGRKAGGGGANDRLVKMMATDAEEISIPTSPCPVPDISVSSTLSIKITRKNQDRHWKLRFIYLQCCEYRHTPPRPVSTHRATRSQQQ